MILLFFLVVYKFLQRCRVEQCFRNLFMKALELLLLPGNIFRTHSLRRGGACRLLAKTGRPDWVVVVGRWASLASARSYLKRGEAAAVLLHTLLTPDVLARVIYFLKFAESAFWGDLRFSDF